MAKTPEVERSLYFNTHVGKTPTYEHIRINGHSYYLNRKRLVELESTINLLCECLTRIEAKLKSLEQFNSLLEVLYETGEVYGENRVIFGENCYGDLIKLSISKRPIYLPIEKKKSTYSYSTDYILEHEKDEYSNKTNNSLVAAFLKEQDKRQNLYYKEQKITNLIKACIEKYLVLIFGKKYDFESHLVELQVGAKWFVCELERRWDRPVDLFVKVLWRGEHYVSIPLKKGVQIKINNKKSKKTKASFNIDTLYNRAKLDAKQKEIETQLAEYREFNMLFERIVEKSVHGANPADGLLYLLEKFKEIQKKTEI